MNLGLEPTYDWRKWRLIIAEEFETWHADGLIQPADGNSMCGRYPLCSFVYLWNNTIQIVAPYGEYKRIYEVDLDRSDELDWLKHIAYKRWSTVDMIMGLASASRRIGKLRSIPQKSSYWDCWSVDRAKAACELITKSNRNKEPF